jgi:hypothetical protein
MNSSAGTSRSPGSNDKVACRAKPLPKTPFGHLLDQGALPFRWRKTTVRTAAAIRGSKMAIAGSLRRLNCRAVWVRFVNSMAPLPIFRGHRRTRVLKASAREARNLVSFTHPYGPTNSRKHGSENRCFHWLPQATRFALNCQDWRFACSVSRSSRRRESRRLWNELYRSTFSNAALMSAALFSKTCFSHRRIRPDRTNSR